ncbi:hypothetical protein GCM10009784_22210 [Arthrobacter parietis]|uniref:Uncharacterized protein n=2 Tax=Arthrobacter TaxID=1663 RepID=A0ABT6CUX2_9MICC|nr:hypothetical protein [Arthrobacter vasquezii]MDF9277877.1 hypothetical protein [Arthrobacter vasquezii]
MKKFIRALFGLVSLCTLMLMAAMPANAKYMICGDGTTVSGSESVQCGGGGWGGAQGGIGDVCSRACSEQLT